MVIFNYYVINKFFDENKAVRINYVLFEFYVTAVSNIQVLDIPQKTAVFEQISVFYKIVEVIDVG